MREHHRPEEKPLTAWGKLVQRLGKVKTHLTFLFIALAALSVIGLYAALSGS